MTKCPEISDVTGQLCSQSVEDHRIAIGEYGLMLKHTLNWDDEEMMVWFTGPGYDEYMRVKYA